jgi:hypothetical protein
MHVFLETPRLVLRRFTRADADNLVSLNADPDVMRFITGGVPIGRGEIEEEVLPAFLGYYERFDGYGFWAGVEKRTGEFLGCFYLTPREGGAPGEAELGFRLRKSAWGKGYATEGSRALIRSGVIRKEHHVEYHEFPGAPDHLACGAVCRLRRWVGRSRHGPAHPEFTGHVSPCPR